MTAARRRVVYVLGGAGVGGAERQLLLLLSRLRELEDARLLVIRGGPLVELLADVVPTQVIAKRGKVDPMFATRLAAAVRRHRPDIVQTWGTTGNVWGSFVAGAGTGRLVMREGGFDLWKGRAHRAVDRFGYRRAAAVVCNARGICDLLAANGTDPARLRVIPNGVVVPADATAGDADRDPRLVVFVGRLHPVKGADVLVEALPAVRRSVPDVRCLLVGPAAQDVEIDFARRLRARIDDLGLGDVIEPVGSVDDVGPLLRRAGLVVVPSRSEGSPNVVYEAMAHGTPVVAAAVGGVPEIVADERTGLLARPEDPGHLAAMIVQTLVDRDAAQQRAARALEVVRAEYEVGSVARRWAALHDEIVRASESVVVESRR